MKDSCCCSVLMVLVFPDSLAIYIKFFCSSLRHFPPMKIIFNWNLRVEVNRLKIIKKIESLTYPWIRDETLNLSICVMAAAWAAQESLILVWKLDGIAPLIKDPSWSNSTTSSGKIATTFEQMMQFWNLLLFWILYRSE